MPECAKPIVLTFVSYYLPGFKAGGPVTTIQNLVEQFGTEYKFMIVTRDHDQGDLDPYQDIHINEWNCLGNMEVYYLAEKKATVISIYRLLSVTPHDVIYLNSFFDFKLSFIPNLIQKLCCQKSPVILAPRGEFSAGALSLKSIRKRLFIGLFKLLGMSNNTIFQASSTHEKEDIKNSLNISDEAIKIASDLPVAVQNSYTRQGDADLMKVVFLSRISPMKNLQFAIQSLQQVVSPIIFNIYGPLENLVYWEKCEGLLSDLPDNVQWRYCGIAQPSSVRSILASHDLMFLPTMGENYGHVIAESISVGTPVLISDRTPWKALEEKGFGWDLDLDNQRIFAEIIDDCARLDPAERAQVRQKILNKAVAFLCTPEQIEGNRMLFEYSLRLKKRMSS